ncbi:N-acetylglucosaminyl-phosphatidylinositol biosynthetic protein-like protein, partial [Leptotrombidium deliense]
DIFTPDTSQRDDSKITVIVISRLVYRKGVDLLASLISILCLKYENLQFIIGGDGPKRIVIEEVIESYQLQDRVTLLGAIRHEHVRDVLVKGDIFLNCSLTEAFCMAIVEAASCGLQVVSTNVGGIPEVLPNEMIWLAEPNVDSLVTAFDKAVKDRENGLTVSPSDAHSFVKQCYQWTDIAKRTEAVYKSVTKDPIGNVKNTCEHFLKSGYVFGSVLIFIYGIELLLLRFFSWFDPVENIDLAPDIPSTVPVRVNVSKTHLSNKNGCGSVLNKVQRRIHRKHNKR